MRATPTTWAPAAANAVAMARPNPRLAPVTIAVVPTRPSAWVSCCSCSYSLSSVDSHEFRYVAAPEFIAAGPMNFALRCLCTGVAFRSTRDRGRDRRATVPAQEDFIEQAAPFRAELIAHCYRMLGSVHDAEDLVQETYLRGWRGYQAFEERAALRTWLYRIATTACLRALENRARRVLPAGLGDGSVDPDTDLDGSGGAHQWLEPIPDALMFATPEDGRHGTAERAAGRDDGPAGASGASAGRADSARRRAVQRRRGCRTPRNHTRRGQQRPAAGAGPSRRGRTHRGRRGRARRRQSAANCSTATARHSKTPTWRPSPSCCKPTSSSKCRRCLCGSPGATP